MIQPPVYRLDLPTSRLKSSLDDLDPTLGSGRVKGLGIIVCRKVVEIVDERVGRIVVDYNQSSIMQRQNKTKQNSETVKDGSARVRISS
jgi:hypothetical protein